MAPSLVKTFWVNETSNVTYVLIFLGEGNYHFKWDSNYNVFQTSENIVKDWTIWLLWRTGVGDLAQARRNSLKPFNSLWNFYFSGRVYACNLFHRLTLFFGSLNVHELFLVYACLRDIFFFKITHPNLQRQTVRSTVRWLLGSPVRAKRPYIFL